MLSFPMLLKSVFLLVSCFGQDPSEPQQPSEQPKKVEDSRLVSTRATVEAIDYKTRKVTLRGPEGNTTSFKVDDSVKNLDQVKVGDQVTVDYYQSLAIQVVKMGTSESGQESVVERAEPGEKPAIAGAKQTTVMATVEAIDYSAPSITLKDKSGTLTKVKVRHPERLKLVKVGDTLKITFLEAVAIAVQPPAKEAH